MSQPLRRRNLPVRVGENRKRVRNEERKPNKRGFKVYVGEGEPLETRASPPWLNDFYYVAGSPIWFCHGLDGETDMGGAYDLTLGAVSGDVAFVMPLEWATSAADATFIPIEVVANTTWTAGVQTVDHTTGEVRVYWPILADPMP